jgi:hypothetical protein
MENHADGRKFHFIYKTTCAITGRYYIGMHSTDYVEDGYLGSGQILKCSVRKYGEAAHVREVLEFLPDRNSLRRREIVLVEQVLHKDPLCMNVHPGGSYGWEHRTNRAPWNKGRRGVLPETREKMRAAKLDRPSPRRGVRLSDEIKQKLRQAHLGRPWSAKRWEAHRKRQANVL